MATSSSFGKEFTARPAFFGYFGQVFHRASQEEHILVFQLFFLIVGKCRSK